MTSNPSREAVIWDEHHYGESPREGSLHLTNSHTASSIDNGGSRGDDSAEPMLRKRRSSISMGIDAIRHAGGVNSIENFARSWQRAAGFYEITPQIPPLVVSPEAAETAPVGARRYSDVEHGIAPKSPLSVLREEAAGEQAAESAADEAHGDSPSDHRSTDRASKAFESGDRDIYVAAPHLASQYGASFGTSYGSFSSQAGEHSMTHAGRLWRQQQERGASVPDKEREPLLVRRVEREDGKVVNVVVGQSTLPQTIFNSVNVLIGVGLLSLPLAVRYAGWLVGMTFLVLSAVVTAYAARILAKCLDVDEALITFADLAYISFGGKARIVTSLLFGVEIYAANVALVVLFADSLAALVPALGSAEWKIVCGIILLPLGFVPLHILSFTSVLGIFSCFGIVLIVIINGFIKPHAPGSLREPAKTYLLPSHWSMLPIAFGLLMSPWGGHSVFPNIYRDMRHPRKFVKGLWVTYIFTFMLDLAMAVAGVLMFGDSVHNEITWNVVSSGDYPHALSVCVVIFVAIVPLTKIPLSARPLFSTIEVLTGLDPRTVPNSQALVGASGMTRGFLRLGIRVLIMVSFVVIAIFFPYFDRVMAFLGSALCFTLCIILPLSFYLKIFGRQIPMKERMLDYFLIAISSVLAVLGTVWAFLPRDILPYR